MKNNHLLAPLIGATFIAVGRASPGCSWDGDVTLNGYVFTCTSSVLSSVTHSSGSMKNKVFSSSNDDSITYDDDAVSTQVYCDWEGPLRFDGDEDCDEFAFECYPKPDGGSYGSVLYSIKSIDQASSCSKIQFSGYGSIANGGPVCNFASPLALNDPNSGARISMDCVDGFIGEMTYVSGRRFLRESADNSNIEEAVEARKPVSSSTPTCSTWATAEGSWELIHEHNQDFSVSMTYGTETTDTDEFTTEFSASLSETFSEGLIFQHDEVSVEVSTSISSSVSSSLTVSYSQTVEVPCSSPDGKNNGGSLFQWLLTTAHTDDPSDLTQVFSDSSVCVGYQDKPQCPLNTCADDLCTTCSDWQSNTTTGGGFYVGSCNWEDDMTINDHIFHCSNNSMDGTIGSASAMSALQNVGSSTSSCAACDWDGPIYSDGPNDCDDFMLECYDGYLYAVTFIGDQSTFAASSCADMYIPPDFSLTGSACNWGNTALDMQDSNSDTFLKLTCLDGVVQQYYAVV
jgi:hypothetical protein